MEQPEKFSQNSAVMSSMNVSHRIQYLFFIVFESLLLFKSLTVTTVEIDKFHALINRNKEKALQWSYNLIA